MTLATMISTVTATNQLLGKLPKEVYHRLLPKLEPCTFEAGDILCEPGRRIDCVFFPTTCIVSLLYTMENGATAEVGLVGNEGVVGISLFMGGGTTPNLAIVQASGSAFRMKAKWVCEEFQRGGPFQVVLLHYIQALMSQIAQTAACNCLHTLEKRLCRRLLLTHDRAPSNQLQITHELLANVLGVRREGVTVAARQLQEAGLIHYTRGRITIVDRKGLEAAACECYQVVKTEFDRLLGSVDIVSQPNEGGGKLYQYRAVVK